MKLSYRGQTYTTNNNAIAGDVVSISTTYRGVKSIQTHKQVTARRHANLTYRGQRVG